MKFKGVGLRINDVTAIHNLPFTRRETYIRLLIKWILLRRYDKGEDPMTRLVMILLLVCIGVGPAYAGWVSLGGDEMVGLTIYVDPSTINRNGDERSLWVLYNFKTAQSKEGGVSFLSATMQREYDCGKSRTRLLTIVHYAGAMESGEMVLKSSPPNQEWAPVGQPESGTIAKDLWTLACSKD